MCDESVGDGHFAGEQLSENVEEVFIVNLPVVPATRFACHLCTDHAQNLSSLEGLKKHFKRRHQNSIIIRFQCRQCELPLRGVKNFRSHAESCSVDPPPPDASARPTTPDFSGFSL